uniref:Putative ovule protein n=1 Tax=Solanum chacoense TaxID=4108 RepID=A0A0V0GVN8_SOLCH
MRRLRGQRHSLATYPQKACALNFRLREMTKRKRRIEKVTNYAQHHINKTMIYSKDNFFFLGKYCNNRLQGQKAKRVK